MPTYEYVCQKCDHEFEVSQSMRDKPLSRCPSKGCGGKIQRKLGVGAGLIFKGAGFYTTDYRSDSYKKAAKAESGGGAETTAAKSEGKGDTAPAKTEKGAPSPAPTKTETHNKSGSERKSTGGDA
ncbi:MAG: FmdB family zinc ribbon protein [Verrucomicrobiales bacterium]